MARQSDTAPFSGHTAGFALGFMTLCLVVYILHVSAAITIPFVIAVFVWYLLNAISRGIGRFSIAGRDIPRWGSYLLAFLLMTAGFWFVYKLIIANGAQILQRAPHYQQAFITFLPQLLDWLPEDYRPQPDDVASYLNVNNFITVLIKTFTGIAGKMLVVAFYTGFLLYEQQFFSRKISEMIGDARTEKRVHKILKNIDIKIQRYIWAKTFVSVMVGLCTWVILMAFHIDFAAFWGVMAFILNFIPYLGTVAAIALPSIIALVQYGDVMYLVKVALGLTAIQLFWDVYIYPRIMGDSLNLSPIFIIIFLAGWGMIWGVPGLFLAMPILAMAVISLGQFDRTRAIAVLLSENGEMIRDESGSDDA